jgi:hypothetical protein
MLAEPIEPNATQDGAPQGAKPARVWTDEEKVEYLAARQWSVSQIIRKTRLSRDKVNAILAQLDEAKVRQLAEGPESRRAWHTAYLEEVARQAFIAFNRSKKGDTRTGNPRLLRVGIEALSQVRKIHGDDAPAKQINLNLSGKTLVHPADQQALINADPAVRDELLSINARRRALGLPVRRDGPGELHGDGRGGLGHPDQPGGQAVDADSSPGGDQQVAHEGDVG